MIDVTFDSSRAFTSGEVVKIIIDNQPEDCKFPDWAYWTVKLIHALTEGEKLVWNDLSKIKITREYIIDFLTHQEKMTKRSEKLMRDLGLS